MDTYEKKFKESFSRAKKLHETCDSQALVGWCEYIFPELKDNGDEMVKQKIIKLIKKSNEVGGYALHKWEADEMLAWIEKQCQKETDEPKFKIGDWILYSGDHYKGVRHITKIDENGYYIERNGLPHGIIPFNHEICMRLWTIQDAEDGDVLAFDNNTIVIFKDLYNATTFHSYCHIEDGLFGVSKDEMPDWWEGKGFHPATKEQRDLLFQKMKEAGYEWDTEKNELKKVEPKFKTGDWVVNKFGDVWHIDSFDSKNYQVSNGDKYCYFPIEKQNEMHLWTIQDAKDGDVLFHSDSASNGIFIFKELLKYEFGEKVICYCDYDSEDHFCLGEHHTCCWADAKILHPATKEQRDILFQKMKEAGYEWDSEKKELKKIEQNIEMVEALRTEYEKGRADAFAQMQKEWSEEDEKCIRLSTDIIDSALRVGFCVQLDRDRCIDWFNSLKERYTWNPSDEQMKALADALSLAKNCGEEMAFDIRTLLEQLKKLKGH